MIGSSSETSGHRPVGHGAVPAALTPLPSCPAPSSDSDIRLESEIRTGLHAAATMEGLSRGRMLRMVDAARGGLPRDRAVRLFVIAYVHAARRHPGRCALTAALDAVARGGL